MTTEMSKEELDARIAGVLGWWEVEGDLYEVVRSPNGGMLATQQDGTPINPAWVISRGRMVEPPR